jgi:hypothetical protein
VPEAEDLSVVLNLRITPDDDERLKKLADPIPRSHVARTALRLGLELIEKRPDLLFGSEKPAPKPGR